MAISGTFHKFTKKSVDAAPQSHGVYELHDDAELIYIGRAVGENVTIRSRLQDHQRGDDGECTEAATKYRYEIMTVVKALIEEMVLVQEYKDANGGDRPPCNDKDP